jgi:hypothetical protein
MTSMQLPVQLEPWRIWLTLLAPDLVEAVGALLLRLDPLVGKLSSSARDAQDAPAGVGDIVLRGNYERMLMSEWLIADAEPDEFLRRAANNELLFTGPEPTVHKRSRLCIALFDVGPTQLGEPRLAHLAMFILLSRRAEEAGAQFLWGVLQMPGKLTAEVGAAGLRGLFGARTLNAASEADLTQWGEALATAGADASDNWLVAGTRACALAPKVISSRIGITRDLLQPRLRVELTQRRSRREAVLPLPDPAQAVRLLRDPFQPLAPLGRIRHMEGRPSLKQAPRFSLTGGSLAVPQLDGGIAVYQVPQSPRVKPGKARLHKPFAGGNVLGTCVHKKAVGLLAAKDSEMVFSGLEGTNFGGAGDRAPRPDNGVLQAPVGLGRWLPLFHHMISEGRRRVARVCLLDQRQTLVAWSFVDVRNSPPSFDMIAEDVLGVAQFGNMLTYAKLENSHTCIYRWNMVSMQTQKVGSVPLIGRSVIFGGGSGWFGGGTGHGVLAVQVNDTEWWLGNDKSTQIITLPDGGTVIGVYSPTRPGNPAHVEGSQNLLVLQAGRKKIYRVGKEGRTNVVDCPAGIAQVAWSANAGHLAWITNEREMFVRRLDMEQPLLHVIPGGEEHER